MENRSLIFEDRRLGMTLGGRFLVRIVSRIFLLVLIIAAGTFVISDIKFLKWTGFLLILFLLDRVLHWGEPDKPLEELPRFGRANIADYLDPEAFRIMEKSYERSLVRRTNFPLELLYGLLEKRKIKETLERLDLSPLEFMQKVKSSLEENLTQDIHSELEQITNLAFVEAVISRAKSISCFDLFAALGKSPSPKMQKLLSIFSLSPEDFSRAASLGKLIALSSGPRFSKIISFVPRGRKIRHRIMNRAWTSRPTPTLDKYGMDFTDLARAGRSMHMVGHKKEYARLIESLSRSLNPNALLIGPMGSGKETLISYLSGNLIKDEIPPALFDRRLVSLDISLLVASAPPEKLQARLQKIVEEIEMAGNIILYIPDIHNLVRTSGMAYMSAADALMPILNNNSFPVIGTTYPKEWKQFIEPRSDFSSLFEEISMEEITEAEAEQVLMFEGLMLERVTGVRVGLGAIKKAVNIAKRYFRERPLPSSAEELLKSAFISAEQNGDKTLGADNVIQAAETKINIPLGGVKSDEAEILLKMEDIIHGRLVDQEEAVKAVAGALREYRSGLTRKGGPIASFLFVGPTGVGKTELAKILSSLQFGSEESMLRFDMTEYQDKQSFIRFIGSPDQSVSGSLTDGVKNKPYSLVLLDEFEKAHPDILNLFLQVLDDGRLTDNEGEIVDFTNTIIIATSNARSELITKALERGEKMSLISERLKKELVGVFKPELLNRFSKVIVFKNLEPHELIQIAKMNLKSLAELLKEQGIDISYSENAVRKIAELGYDPSYGARPLRRVIDERLKSKLSEAILRKELGPGTSVYVDEERGEFSFGIAS